MGSVWTWVIEDMQLVTLGFLQGRLSVSPSMESGDTVGLPLAPNLCWSYQASIRGPFGGWTIKGTDKQGGP